MQEILKTKQEGDVRSVCEKCEMWINKKCGGCFVGFGYKGSYDGSTQLLDEGEEWDELCSTICRDEDIAVGRLRPLGLFSHTFIRNKGEQDGREGVAPCKRGNP